MKPVLSALAFLALLSCALPAVAVAKAHKRTHPVAPAAATKPWEGEFQPATTPFRPHKGYAIQVLDPVGARLLKPDGWFYDRAYDHRGYTWILSRENPNAAGGYQTGLRVQLLQGLRRGVKKSPQEFISGFFAQKKAAGVKILPASVSGGCREKDFTSYHRACFETEEEIAGQGKRKFHLAYSAFWNNDTDTLFIMTFGAPAAEWKNDRVIASDMLNRLDLPDVDKKMKEAGTRDNGICLPGMSPHQEDKLYSYVKESGLSKPGVFTVGALGDEEFPLAQADPHPVSAPEFAARVKAATGYTPDAKIVLVWSYSTAGNAPFAKEVHAIMGNEVTGADGPLWWYPNGTAAVTDPKKGLQWPSAQNITTCILGDGTVLKGQACHSVAVNLDHSKAIFGNAIFAPQNCANLGKMAFNAVMGQRDDSLALFLYYSFVSVDRDRASTYLSLSAYGHQPLAEYFAAQEIRESNHGVYLELLRDAAADGDKKAAGELPP